MGIYLSHWSALAYWASTSIDASVPTTFWRRAAPLPSSCKVTADDVQAVLDQGFGNAGGPLHVLVPNEAARSRSKRAVCHVASCSFPRNSFAKVSAGIFASSPELCFVQLATKLSLIALIRLGFELCGVYGIATIGRMNYDRKAPLTTKARLERFIDAAGALPGIAKARKALRHIVAGSASPMETALVLLLCLPLRLGGYALPAPHMNRGIDPVKRCRFAASERRYFCDLVWPDASFALEYDSVAYHAGAHKMADDALRRAKLLERGITVVSITRRTVRNLIELDRIATILAKKLGKRLRSGSAAWQAEQHKLQGALLDFVKNRPVW